MEETFSKTAVKPIIPDSIDKYRQGLFPMEYGSQQYHQYCHRRHQHCDTVECCCSDYGFPMLIQPCPADLEAQPWYRRQSSSSSSSAGCDEEHIAAAAACSTATNSNSLQDHHHAQPTCTAAPVSGNEPSRLDKLKQLLKRMSQPAWLQKAREAAAAKKQAHEAARQQKARAEEEMICRMQQAWADAEAEWQAKQLLRHRYLQHERKMNAIVEVRVVASKAAVGSCIAELEQQAACLKA